MHCCDFCAYRRLSVSFLNLTGAMEEGLLPFMGRTACAVLHVLVMRLGLNVERLLHTISNSHCSR
jgi:hypothetical protein